MSEMLISSSSFFLLVKFILLFYLKEAGFDSLIAMCSMPLQSGEAKIEIIINSWKIAGFFQSILNATEMRRQRESAKIQLFNSQGNDLHMKKISIYICSISEWTLYSNLIPTMENVLTIQFCSLDKKTENIKYLFINSFND